MAALGRAMQRTNILRDIDEDLEHGRLYVSHSTIERFGFPSPGARRELLRDQIARADELYDEALGAMPLLAQGRRGMSTCTVLYREILRQIEREGFGERPGRVVVPAWRRRLLTLRVGVGAGWGPSLHPGLP
jgi:phytoene synthase